MSEHWTLATAFAISKFCLVVRILNYYFHQHYWMVICSLQPAPYLFKVYFRLNEFTLKIKKDRRNTIVHCVYRFWQSFELWGCCVWIAGIIIFLVFFFWCVLILSFLLWTMCCVHVRTQKKYELLLLLRKNHMPNNAAIPHKDSIYSVQFFFHDSSWIVIWNAFWQ